MKLKRIHSSESGGTFIETLPAFDSTPLRREQILLDGGWIDPRLVTAHHIPKSGVLVLDGGGSLSAHSWTITKDGGWIYDATGVRQVEHNFRCFSTPKISAESYIGGLCLDIGSNWCVENYAHWLIDSIGRLAVLEGSGFLLEDFDYVRIPTGKFRQCQDVLDALQIPRSKLITEWHPDRLLRFDRLVRPTLPGEAHYYHSRVPAFLADLIRLPVRGPEKVYLRRHGRRSVVNQAALEQTLIERGFEVIDPAADPFGGWTAARVVISSHAAGMGDLVFCRKGGQLLELMSPSWQRMFFATLSEGKEFDYQCLIGTSDSKHENINANFRVDVSVVSEWADSVACAPQPSLL